jgi:hypothetical protein
MQFTRRRLLQRASFLMFLSVLMRRFSFAQVQPKRLARKDCFFGMHLDLHPVLADKELGRDITPELIANLIEQCHVDFIQYDSKGHPGYLGFPSTTGMSAPGIVKDSLAVYRKVTAERGVALYNHFSGVLDVLAVTRHPEWARVNSSGEPDKQETSLFSPYVDSLMIPELTEAAQNYNLDGSWVDGDCWAVQPDYGEASAERFRTATGISKLPVNSSDPGWHEFLDLQRQQFRRYVERYVSALHKAKPRVEITSNWMYSTFVPERPSIALDFLSGDVADQAPIRRARVEARYFAAVGKPWDLMSWGFETGDEFKFQSNKPVVALQQEAAVIIAQGGAFQIYYLPSRAGWVEEHLIDDAAAVGAFCRQRQLLSHHSRTLPEVGVLFSGRSLYRTGNKCFGEWDLEAMVPAEGSLDALLACGYSVDYVPDWATSERIADYPVVVIPDWKDIGPEHVAPLLSYVADGGRLMLCGAENARLFAKGLSVEFSGALFTSTRLLSGEIGFATLQGSWIAVRASAAQALAQSYPDADSRTDGLPMAVRLPAGKGTVVLCPGPLLSGYASASSPITLAVIRRAMAELASPMVAIENYPPSVEVVLRSKRGETLIHLVDTTGASVTGRFRHTGVVPQLGPLNVQIRLKNAPKKAVAEPGGAEITGRFQEGVWHAVLPPFHIHTILRIVT